MLNAFFLFQSISHNFIFIFNLQALKTLKCVLCASVCCVREEKEEESVCACARKSISGMQKIIRHTFLAVCWAVSVCSILLVPSWPGLALVVIPRPAASCSQTGKPWPTRDQ